MAIHEHTKKDREHREKSHRTKSKSGESSKHGKESQDNDTNKKSREEPKKERKHRKRKESEEEEEEDEEEDDDYEEELEEVDPVSLIFLCCESGRASGERIEKSGNYSIEGKFDTSSSSGNFELTSYGGIAGLDEEEVEKQKQQLVSRKVEWKGQIEQGAGIAEGRCNGRNHKWRVVEASAKNFRPLKPLEFILDWHMLYGLTEDYEENLTACFGFIIFWMTGRVSGFVCCSCYIFLYACRCSCRFCCCLLLLLLSLLLLCVVIFVIVDCACSSQYIQVNYSAPDYDCDFTWEGTWTDSGKGSRTLIIEETIRGEKVIYTHLNAKYKDGKITGKWATATKNNGTISLELWKGKEDILALLNKASNFVSDTATSCTNSLP